MPSASPRFVDPARSLAPLALLESIDLTAVEPGRGTGFAGVAMFLDLSGFTAMSEQLGRLGSTGTEELVGLLNAFFVPAIATVRATGGDVVAFGGDAITAVWTGHAALHDASSCAGQLLDLVATLTPVRTSAGPIELHARIGVATGALRCDVGGSATRHVIVLHGDAIDRAVDCEHRASLDSVVTDVEHPIPSAGPARSAGADGPPIDSACLAHPVIIERLRRGDHALISGHRRVTTLFAQLGADPGMELVSILAAVASSVEELGGEVIQVTGGDKGTVAMATFGAPTSSPEDAPRAIAAARRMVELMHSAAVGISTGTVFAGRIGSDERQVYTVIGDSVNLAARLMQHAESGEVLVDEATRSTSAVQFAFGPVGVLSVKGRTEVVLAAAVTERLGRSWPTNRLSSDGPLIGRDVELRACEQALDGASHGLRRVIVSGRAGMGKSRLVRALSESAGARKWTVLPSGFAGFGDATPYAGWQPILRRILNGFDDLGERVDLLVPGAGQLAPLLGPLVGLELADTPTTLTMTGEVRSELAEDLAARLIGAAARDRPLLLILEDWHWADESSGRLLETLTGRMGGSAIVIAITTRVDEQGPAVRRRPADSTISLGELTPVEARRLTSSAWARARGDEPRPEDIDRLAAHGGGNPLMLETLTQLDAGDAVPSDLTTLLQSRLDGLADDELRPLLWASAFARPFTPDELGDALARAGHRDERLAALDRLIANGLLMTAPLADEVALSFRHASIQEAAYLRLSHETRRDIHFNIALTLEDRHASAIEIARHIGETTDRARKLRWFDAAASETKAAWALDETIEWLRRLILLDPEPAGLADASIELAEALVIRGDIAGAEGALADARSSASDPRTLRCRGEIALLVGRVDEAIVTLEDALDRSSELGSSSEIIATAELLSRALAEAGRFDEALQVAESAVADVAGGEAEDRLRALGALGAVLLMRLSLPAAAAALGEAIALADGANDRVRAIHLGGDLAATRALLGDIGASMVALTEARQLASGIGYRRHLAMSQGNESEIRLLVGDFDRALPGTMTSLVVLAQLGDVGMGSDSLLRLAANRSLPVGDRARIMDAGIALERRLDRPHALADWRVAEVELLASGPTAGPAAERVRAEAIDLDRPDLELRVLLTGTVEPTDDELGQLRGRLDSDGERFLCDVVRARRSSDLAAPTELLDRGRALYRRTPFLSYREALIELGEADPVADVTLPPRVPTDDDVDYALDLVLEIIADFHRRLDGH